MNEVGVLGAFIPEFGRIVAMMQFNMYHYYTVDEHIIRTISTLSQIERRELADDLPVATDILAKGVNRRVLYVALLLHDIGKGSGRDHSAVGAEIAARLCPRLGLDAEETELVVWLVQQPPADVRRRAEARPRPSRAPSATSPSAVKSPTRLKLLTVLTVCDIRGVGPGRLEQLEGDAAARPLRRDARVPDRRQPGAEPPRARGRGQGGAGRDARPTGRGRRSRPSSPGTTRPTGSASTPAPTRSSPSWSASSPRRRAGDARSSSTSTATPPRPASPCPTTRASSPASPARWRSPAPTSSTRAPTPPTDGIATAAFWIQDAEGKPYEQARLTRLRNGVDPHAQRRDRRPRGAEGQGPLKKRERDFVVPTRISFDNTGSDIYTIIEVETRDRPGPALRPRPHADRQQHLDRLGDHRHLRQAGGRRLLRQGPVRAEAPRREQAAARSSPAAQAAIAPAATGSAR